MSQSQILRKAMKLKGFDASGSDLARVSGVHITLVRRYLDGSVSVGAKNAGRISEALDLPLAQVLYGSAA